MAKKILHLADLHLGSRHAYLGDAAALRAREADGVLERIAAWLTGPSAPDVGAVLIAGDLFDRADPPDDLVERAVLPLRAMISAGIAVVTLPGNHDEWTYPDGVFRRRDSSWPGRLVTEAEPSVVATIDLGGVSAEIVACAFWQGRNPEPRQWKNPFPSDRAPETRRIGLFHGTLVDRLGTFIAEGERTFAIELDRLASWGVDYLALGHIHKRQAPKSGACLAVYPGPVEGLGFADPGARVLTLVDMTSPQAVLEPVDAIKIGVRSCDFSHLELDAAGIAGPEDLDRRIAAEGEPGGEGKIVRVTIRGRPDFPIDAAETRRRHISRFRALEIVAEAPAADLGDWEALAEQRTLEGIFVARILAARATDPDGARGDFWDRVAEEGLHALRGEAS